MQKILWIGKDYFAGALEGCGFEKVMRLPEAPAEVYAWDRLLAACGFTPDMIVIAAGIKPTVLGIEHFPCLTVLYSPDAHLNPWQEHYAQGFDACIVTQADQVASFSRLFLSAERVCWLPPFATDAHDDRIGVSRNRACVFLENATDSARDKLLGEIQLKVPELEKITGQPAQVYPQSRIVVHMGKGGLDFELFEAMGAGVCVLTPRVGHGMETLFVDGEHLVGFAPLDAGDAAYRLQFLLEHPELVEYIGETARQTINEGHRPSHRAWAFTDFICTLMMQDMTELIRRRKAQATQIVSNALAKPYHEFAVALPEENMRASFSAAARGEFGLSGCG